MVIYYAFETSRGTPFIGFVEFEAKKIVLAGPGTLLILYVGMQPPKNSQQFYPISMLPHNKVHLSHK